VLIFQQVETTPAAIADQPQSAKPPATSAPADRTPPPIASPQPAAVVPPVKRGVPKWVWIGVAGGIVLLVLALLASVPNPLPNPESTEPSSAVEETSAATDEVQPPTEEIPPTEALPPPPIVVENSYTIDRCCGPEGEQMSDQLDYVMTVDTIDLLQIYFEANELSCSDIQLHIFLDDDEIHTTEFFGPIAGSNSTDWIDLGPVSQRTHTLLLRPEGRETGQPGDCNQGTLGGWGGTLLVRSNQYP
jgi:hypothetical protein